MAKIESEAVNSGFLNRLVGTSIVVVVAIIFIPIILDGEKVHFKDGFKAIPERPEFTTVDIKQEIENKVELSPEILPTPIQNERAVDAGEIQVKTDIESLSLQQDTVKSDKLVVQTQKSEEPEQVSASTEKPVQEPVQSTSPDSLARAETSNFTKMAYVIQLGSFSHKANVQALLKKLEKAGFTAFTRPIKTPNGELTKVFVGPQLDKEDLASKLPELEKLTKLKGRLTQFNITK